MTQYFSPKIRSSTPVRGRIVTFSQLLPVSNFSGPTYMIFLCRQNSFIRLNYLTHWTLDLWENM